MDSEVYGIKRSHIIISVAVMVTVIIAEIVSCLCMTSVKPAEGLVVDYEAAKDSMTELETELRVMEGAKKENADAFRALSLLMTGRPAEVGFETLAVQAGAEDGSWASVSVRAKNEDVLQRYMSNLTANSAFGGVAIVSSQKNPDGSINAVISVQKGEAR
ncbi:MAG: hypothetical protein IIZ54_00520 [Selenomonadaceae bacterium]|nr:hypothetical protein [Selenomonadaceae bacterium]